MKKKIKDYAKMKQLDRIEYLLLKKEKEFTSLTIMMLPFFIIFILVFTTFSVLMFHVSENTSILKDAIKVVFVTQYLIGMSIIVDVVSYIIHRKKVKQIDKLLFKE